MLGEQLNTNHIRNPILQRREQKSYLRLTMLGIPVEMG